MANGDFKVEFDSNDVLDTLSKLTDNNYIKSKVLVTALKKGGEVLQKNTVQVMKSKLGSVATKNEHHSKPMAEGVRVIVDKNYYDVIVSIMKDYRLKWFETGTDDRYTKGKITGQSMVKKGDGNRLRNIRSGTKAYRGKIDNTYFFKDARENTTGIDNAINASLTDSLNKIFKA